MWETLESKSIEFVDESFRAHLCVRCGRVLVEPLVAPCTCRLCLRCVDELFKGAAGEAVCPGPTDECRSSVWSREDWARDHHSARTISLLAVRCRGCRLESPLKAMGEHLRLCRAAKARCLLADLGCDGATQSRDSLALDDHFQISNEAHLRIIVNLIDNLRNELRETGDRLDKRAGIGERCQDRIDEIRLTCGDFGRQADGLARRLGSSDNEMAALKQMVDRIATEQQIMKNDTANKTKMNQIEEENKKLANKIDRIVVENSEMKAEIDRSKKLIGDLRLDLKLAELMVSKEMNGFVWKINNLSSYKGKNEILWSDYFYDSERHKLCLTFYPDGYGDIRQAHMSTELCMSKYQCHEATQFTGTVTMELINQSNGDGFNPIKKKCDMEKNSVSLPFNFISSDLPETITKADRIIIRCSILFN